jgi:hypothetical protein
MYDRGWFEYSAQRNSEGVLSMPDSEPASFASRRQPSDTSSGWISLEDAASALNKQAIVLLPKLADLRSYAEDELFSGGVSKLWPSLGGFQNLVKAVYRAQVIHYELKDAFLRVTAPEAETFRTYPCRLVEGLKFNADSSKVANNIHRMFRESTAVEWDAALSLCVTDEFLLLGLCGINAYYRQHSSSSYLEGLELLRPLENYIKNERRRSKDRESLGLLGLAAYLRGRLKFGLSQYGDARDAWTESCEYYTLKIEQKRVILWGDDERKREKWEDTRSLCLRRTALAAAMGNGYLLLVLSKLNACLEVVVLSRAVLTKSCGRVYGAYVDLIYAAAKRAKHSSQMNVLQECEERLGRCLGTFRDLVPGSHYVERANIELAMIFHYQAKALDRLSRQGALSKPEAEERIKYLYQEALTKITSAIHYAEGRKDPAKRNPRMIAEAYALRSHLWRHRPEDDYQRATNPGWREALKDAHEALKHVGKMSQLECEGRMSLGAAYLSIAEGLKSGKLLLHEITERKDVIPEGKGETHPPTDARRKRKQEPHIGETDREIWKFKELADEQLISALEINKRTNPRISAVCFLRLAQSGLLMETTVPDAWFYFGQYQEIADRVEHAFCHEQAVEIGRALRRKGRSFFVDVRQRGFNLAAWERDVKDYLKREVINRIVENMPKPPSGKNDVGSSTKSSKRGPKVTLLGQLAKDIESHTGFTYKPAMALAKNLEEEFLNKLKAAGKYVGDDDGQSLGDSNDEDLESHTR